MSSDIRLCEYFVITGLEKNRNPYDLSQIYSHTEEIFNTNLKIEEDFFKFKEPIVDIQLVNLNQKEQVPEQYYVVEKSYTRQNKGFLYTKATNEDLYLCFRFGRDKPPITDIWVQNPKQMTPITGSPSSLSTMTTDTAGNNSGNWTYIEYTVSKRYSASLNNSQSNPLYVCYKRASLTDSVDSLAVTDICVIVANKNEQCPPAYTRVNVPIKRSTLGNTVNICYKKSLVKQHVLTYKPETIYCLPCTSVQPILDKSKNPPIGSILTLPPEIRDVANFCMPWGATIETWSEDRKKPKPSFLNFVLTDEKYNRMYGSAVQFYDEISVDQLTEEECTTLQINRETDENGCQTSKKRVYMGKSICLLSRISSFTQAFNKVLAFLLKESYRPKAGGALTMNSSIIELPLERYISQFLHSVPFPTPETPNISLLWDVINPITIHLPHNALSQFGNRENLYHLIRMLEVDQVIQLFVYMLTEQKILLTSTCNSDLTGIAEALLAIIFPFRWTVTYIPFLYLSCIHIIQSPSPYLIGVDSRFFDYFRLPEGVGCVDLVTKSIKTPDDDCCNWKQLDFQKVLPSNVLSRLRNGLSTCKYRVSQFEKQQMIRRNREEMVDEVDALRKREDTGEAIRECFLKATISLFSNYQNFLIPLDLRHSPDNMFQTEAFLKLVDKKSRPLYQAIFDTQLWNNFVLSRSQSIKFDDSLVFFDRCIKRMNDLNDERANTITLIQNDTIGIDSEVTRVIEPPTIPENWSPVITEDLRLSFPTSFNSDLMLSNNIIHSDESADNNSTGAAHLSNSLLPISDSPQLLTPSPTGYQGDSSSITGGLSTYSKTNGVNKSFSSNQLDTSMGNNSGNDFRGSNVGLDNANVSDIPVLIIRPDLVYGQRAVPRRSSGMSILKRPLEELKQARQMAYDAKQQMLHQNQHIQYHNTGGHGVGHNNQHVWATQLLASSYCLWFLTLPGLVGHILDTPGLGETGLADRILQLSMELLGGLGSHGINLPDEVCCRIVMLLIHQLRPVHFRVADLRQFTSLNAFSYGLCNQITLEENQEEQLLHEMDLHSQIYPQTPGIPDMIENTHTEQSDPQVQPEKLTNDIDKSESTTEKPKETNIKQPDNEKATKLEKTQTEVDKPSCNDKNVPKQAKYNKKMIGPDGEIEIGGKVVKLRGKKQTTIGYGKEMNNQERDRKRKHDRFSVLLFQPMSFGSGASSNNFPSLTNNANLNNMTTIGEELSSLGKLHSNLQLVDKKAGLLMSSTTQSPQMILSDDLETFKKMLTSSSTKNKMMMPYQSDNKMKPPKLQMFKQCNNSGSINENLNPTNTNNDISGIPPNQSTANTNPIGQAMIFKSPFSEERSEIHHSFLKTSSSTQDATKVPADVSYSEKRLTGTSMVTDVIESLQECNVSAKSSEISYDTGPDDRLTQSEFGSGNIANKTRASFRQMKSVANRSIRSMKNIMSVLNTSSTPEHNMPWTSTNPNQAKQQQNYQPQSSSNQRSGIGGGLPATFRPWDSSKQGGTSSRKSVSGPSFSLSSKTNIGQKDRRVTGSVDLLDRIPDAMPGGHTDASYRPGLATVQQIRRYNRTSASSVHVTPHNTLIHQYDSGRITQTNTGNHTPGGGGSWLFSQFENVGIKNSTSTDSIHSDPSISSNSQDSEPIILNLENAWEQITGSLSAVLLPTGKYWSSTVDKNTINNQINDSKNEEATSSTPPPSPTGFVTRECHTSLLVNMTTGSECVHCHQIIYDDSIMNSWSWDDSDHRAVCYSCEQNFTPKLKFQVYIVLPVNSTTNPSNSPENNLQQIEYREILAYRNEVNYLSPFVIRKGLESLLEKEGESSLLKLDLLSKHEIYYWNLLWYFTRLSLPSQLPSYLTQWLKKHGEGLIRQNESNKTKYQILSDLTGYEKVQIHTYWEFSQLSSKYHPSLKSEWILYRQMLHVGAPLNEHTIFVVNIIKHIFDDFQRNDLSSAILRLLGQRKMRIDYAVTNNTTNTPINHQQMIQTERSIYRELYFLIYTKMDPKIANYDYFHQAFYELWPQIEEKYRNLIGSQDKPPSQSTIFCRKVYRNLFL